jgi:hypothetical protein
VITILGDLLFLVRFHFTLTLFCLSNLRRKSVRNETVRKCEHENEPSSCAFWVNSGIQRWLSVRGIPLILYALGQSTENLFPRRFKKRNFSQIVKPPVLSKYRLRCSYAGPTRKDIYLLISQHNDKISEYLVQFPHEFVNSIARYIYYTNFGQCKKRIDDTVSHARVPLTYTVRLCNRMYSTLYSKIF